MMLTTQTADLLKTTRKTLRLSQKELAGRAGVSLRLVAEVERGERPHVSFETALRLLGAVGISIRLTDPLGNSCELGNPSGEAVARAARAAVRRATWQGRQIRLSQKGGEEEEALTNTQGADPLAAVALVSEQAYAIADARRTVR